MWCHRQRTNSQCALRKFPCSTTPSSTSHLTPRTGLQMESWARSKTSLSPIVSALPHGPSLLWQRWRLFTWLAVKTKLLSRPNNWLIVTPPITGARVAGPQRVSLTPPNTVWWRKLIIRTQVWRALPASSTRPRPFSRTVTLSSAGTFLTMSWWTSFLNSPSLLALSSLTLSVTTKAASWLRKTWAAVALKTILIIRWRLLDTESPLPVVSSIAGASSSSLLETAGALPGVNRATSDSAWIKLANPRPPMELATSIVSLHILPLSDSLLDWCLANSTFFHRII